MSAVLSAEGASFGYGRPILCDVTLRVAAGERVAVVGPNGAGKTTLLRGFLGLRPALAGVVRLGTDDVAKLPRHEIARRAAYLPQEIRSAAGLTALDVVLLGRATHRARGPAAWAFDSPDEVACARTALADVGIEVSAARPFHELSGGERRLVLVAQALAQAGQAILLDEPTAALDLRAQIRVVDRLADAAARRGLAVVIVTHDIGLAARLCPRLVLLGGGGVVADGDARAVVKAELLERVFGVPVAVIETEGGRPIVVPR